MATTVTEQLAAAGARDQLTAEGQPGAAQPALDDVSLEVAPGEIEHAALRADQVRAVPPLQDPEKLAVLLYTGGTTGLPRAAMLTHRALLANVEQVASVEPPMIRAACSRNTCWCCGPRKTASGRCCPPPTWWRLRAGATGT